LIRAVRKKELPRDLSVFEHHRTLGPSYKNF
jgi:hypothetical protein